MPTSDLAGILAALQKRTGESFDAASFDTRLRIQKSIYLLKAFRFAPATSYSFSDYFHGPYSPNLAKDYYGLLADRSSRQTPHAAAPIRIPETILHAIDDAVRRGNDFLEASATIHSLATRYHGLPVGQIRALFEPMKPRIAGNFEEAWHFLRENGLVAAHT